MEDEDEEEDDVSSFYNPPLFNNNESSPMMTRPLWWWFTKDVLRRTTKGTQLEEDDNVDEKVPRTNGETQIEGSKSESEEEVLSRRRQGGAYAGKALSQGARAHIHTFYCFFMCPVASEGSNSLVAVSFIW